MNRKSKKTYLRTIITIAIIGGSFALIGWVLNNNKKENEEKTAIVAQSDGNVAVRVGDVKRSVVQNDFSANGNFIPIQQINFAAENSGRITKVLVDEGSRVSIGQLLAVIKADQLNVDVESANAALANAQSDVHRYENAFKTGGVTQQQLDQAKLSLTNAKARLEQAKLKVGDTYVRSSINGIVNRRLIEPGAVVAPGTQLFEIVNVSKLKLRVTVNEEQVAGLKVGDSVKIQVSVFPDKQYFGKITFIAPIADNALNFPLEIELASNPDNQIRAGMYGTALFEFKNSTPLLLVPRSAFVGSVNNNQVFVVSADNKATLQKVLPGRVFGEQVEVLNGLQEGEQVVITGHVNLQDGSPISIVQ